MINAIDVVINRQAAATDGGPSPGLPDKRMTRRSPDSSSELVRDPMSGGPTMKYRLFGRHLLAARELDIAQADFERISQAGAPDLGEPHNHNRLSMDFVGGGPYYKPLYHAV